MTREEFLSTTEASSSFEVVFFDKKHSNKLPHETRALVKDKDGVFQMAVWLGEKYGWCDEGSYCSGLGSDIRDEVVEFALNGF
jgi:hypothetical protein|tara:strand:- start:36028 stop:36276 length:249 start_codon:yes stop_codon:yes gene_type:complete